MEDDKLKTKLNTKYLKLEITNCLMEIEYRKLEFLRSQLLNKSNNLTDLLKLKISNEIFFIEKKIGKLQQEYRHIGLEFIEVNRINYMNKQNYKNQIQFINANLKKNNRSQPAIGIKQTSKSRPTIFPIIESYQKENQQPELDDNNKETIIINEETIKHLYENVHFNGVKDSLLARDTSMTTCDLETLLHHLLPTPQYTPDDSFIFTFLLSSRLFMKPENLFQQVFFEHFLCRTGLQKFYKHFIENLLYEWITVFPYDFLNEKLMVLFREFACKSASLLEKNFTKNLHKYLEKKLNHLMFYENYLSLLKRDRDEDLKGERGGGGKSPVCGHNLNSTSYKSESSSSSDEGSGDENLDKAFLLDLFRQQNNEKNISLFNELKSLTRGSNLLDFCSSDPLKLARQLTLIEFERLSFIGPQEFVQTFIKEQLKNPMLADKLPLDIKSTSTTMKCTRNVENYVAWFNRLSYLVATEILFQTKPKHRVKMVELWIEVAWECFHLRNFNSLMAIIAGLNMSSVSRLKKMWSKLHSLPKFQTLESQMDPSNNFANYRAILKASMWISNTKTDEDPKPKIVIPFFSLLVKDLYFLNEGCANRLPNGHINFEKCWQFSKQITEFLVWREYQCTFEKSHKVIFYLETKWVCQDENELALASFQCESPENALEKSRLQILRKSPICAESGRCPNGNTVM